MQTKLIKGKKLFVQHNLKKRPVPARDFLLSVGVEKEKINKLFDNSGNWIYTNTKQIDPYNLSPKKLKSELFYQLFPIYRLVNQSLDKEFEHGFNRHDMEHVEEVTNELLKLLTSAHASKKELVIGLVASAAHDLGNLLSRPMHQHLSVDILRLILPNLKLSRADWREIKKVIEIHDEKNAAQTIAKIEQQSTNDVYQQIGKSLGRPALALIIADKTRVGRNRISKKPKSKAAIDKDIHLEINLLGKTTSLNLSNKRFYWNIQYNPYATNKEAQEMPHLFRPKSTSAGYKAIVSDDTQSKYLHNIPADHLSTWKQKFWATYHARNLVAIKCIFALFPEIDKVVVEIIDFVSGNSGSHESSKYLVSKDAMEQFEKFIHTKHIHKSKRK